jgi:uncharacterized protein
MLSFDLAEIASHAVQVDGTLGVDDPVWGEGDPKPASPIHVTGRLSSAGAPGRVYWQGHLAGSAKLECRRCLTDVELDIEDDVHVLFAEPGDEDSADDPDVYPIDPRRGELDLRPAVREQWLLAAPGYALCRDDCKGLCPSCGANLNQVACDCAPTTDSRWDALRAPRPGAST